jgi:hypothetical protein
MEPQVQAADDPDRSAARLGRWTAIFLSLFGSYRKDDSVDVQYELGGRMMVAIGSRSWRPRS